MRRFAVSLTMLALFTGALVPASSAAKAQATFRGAGSARVLDVSVPPLRSSPGTLALNLCGLIPDLGLPALPLPALPLPALPPLPIDLPCKQESVERVPA